MAILLCRCFFGRVSKSNIGGSVAIIHAYKDNDEQLMIKMNRSDVTDVRLRRS